MPGHRLVLIKSADAHIRPYLIAPMDVHILFFAALRDLVGKGEQTLTLPDGVTTIAALRSHLERAFPPLAGRLDSVRFAQNEAFVGAESTLRAGDVVALIPPVAGG